MMNMGQGMPGGMPNGFPGFRGFPGCVSPVLLSFSEASFNRTFFSEPTLCT